MTNLGGGSALHTALVCLVTAALAGCRPPPRPDVPLYLGVAPQGPDTRVTLYAVPHLKINARLAPALELGGGKVLRFTGSHLTPDSAYFTEPPSALVPGRHDRPHGTLRASVCRDDERVCRSVTLEL